MNIGTRIAATILVVILTVAVQQTSAQLLTPYLAKEGITSATTAAKDSVGTDARLIAIAAPGNINVQTFTLSFNVDDGKATGWAYIFDSPTTGKTTTVAVVKIPILGFQSVPLGSFDLPLTIPDTAGALDVTKTYSNSDKMVARLKTDTAFTNFRARLPDVYPAFVTYAGFLANLQLPLPDGFPLNEPLWTISYTGAGDSSLTCIVAAQSGTTFCLSIQGPPLSVAEADQTKQATLVALPNPATGATRINVALPEGVSIRSGVGVALYNAAGERVMDLTENFARNDFRFVEFDAHQLAAGRYFCRAQGPTWSGNIGVVVTGR